MIYYLIVTKNNKAFPKLLASLIIIFFPLLSYFYYLKIITGNFLAAIEIQKKWGNQFIPFSFFSTYLKVYGFTIQLQHVLSIVWIVFLFILFLYYIVIMIKTKKIKKEVVIFFINFLINLINISSLTSLNSIFRYSLHNIGLFILPIFYFPKVIQNNLFKFFLILILYGMQIIFFGLFLTNIPAYGF
ncbi:MAG: hypothetical protein NC925_04485 [Candidatus Omnitrophica bacterium]|nr:hypothetical protein [Candidatus Omnitrophota bacterium]